MSVSPSISTSYSAPLAGGERLTTERLRAGLEACGYHCTTAVLSGTRSLPPGCTISLQFGDRVAKDLVTDAAGATCMTVRCSIRINGSDERVSSVTHWRIHKEVPAPGGVHKLRFAVEADLILGGDIGLAAVLAHGGDVYRHLHLLIVDASLTLHGLSLDDLQHGDADDSVMAPVMRIEARYYGDIAAGRSGLVTSDGAGDFTHPASVAARHLRITRAACDWLKDDALPELASAVRRMILQAQTANRYPLPAARTIEQTSIERATIERTSTVPTSGDLRQPQSQLAFRAQETSPHTAAPPGESDVTAAFVPERIQ